MLARSIVAGALVLAVGACGNGETAQPPGPTTVEGTIASLREPGGVIAGMVLDTEEGRIQVLIDPDQDYGFDLEHLREHVETGDPVRVTAERRGDALVALSIDDA
ncbi:MAG: OB-fold nucleic acid binding domain-containing protein [Actinomycetota bacterium]|nr:OB-fold nucleic acid binding domain-containing protein [Actinomycetota bacterium]